MNEKTKKTVMGIVAIVSALLVISATILPSLLPILFAGR